MSLDFIKKAANGIYQSVLAVTTFTGNPNEIIGTNASGFVDTSFIDPNALADTEDATVATGVTLAAGDLVTFNSSGEVILADNTAYATRAQGYVEAAFSAGATATVFKTGTNTVVSTTPGTEYFLDTAGDITATAPSYAVGTICQTVGYGSPAGLVFEYNEPVEFNVQS